MVEVEQIHEDDEIVTDPALLSRLRRIDAALVELCEYHAAQDQRLMQIKDAIGRLGAAVERHDALLTAWLAPGLELRGLMAQLAEIGRMNARAVAALAAQLTREHADTREAIDLAVGAAGLGEAEAS